MASAPGSSDTILQVHWLGKKAVAGDRNASALMKIWNMPESARLESQTLDKLSTSPWRLLRGDNKITSNNLLRPLLPDLVDEECYAEIRRAPNAASEMVLAIRLNNQRADLWETNLAGALVSLTGIRPAMSGSLGPNARWSLKKHHAPNLIEFARAGQWVVLGAAQDRNELLDQALARIKQGQAPIAISGAEATSWLEVSADLPRLAEVLGVLQDSRAELPKVSFTVAGESQKVRTHGEIVLPDSRSIQLSAWNIPTNLINGDVAGFTAIRGVGPWLAKSKVWTDFHAGPPPDQLFAWALQALPMQTFFAAPISDAKNAVAHITDTVLQKGAPWFATNKLAGFKRSDAYNGLFWTGLPYVTPFLESVETNRSSYVVGGFFHIEKLTQPLPPALLKEVFGRPDLVYYDWELSNFRVAQWIYLGQFLRLVSDKAQLPMDSAGLVWLKAITPKLETCATEATQTAPGRLSFTRNSTVGLNAVELHLLVDWLESPEFPRGLHTLSARPGLQMPGVNPGP